MPIGEIGSEDDLSSLSIHCSRRADANPANLVHLQIAFIDGVLNAFGNSFDDSIRPAVGFGAALGFAQGLELGSKNTGQDFGPSQIDSDEIFPFRAGFRHSGCAPPRSSRRWRPFSN